MPFSAAVTWRRELADLGRGRASRKQVVFHDKTTSGPLIIPCSLEITEDDQDLRRRLCRWVRISQDVRLASEQEREGRKETLMGRERKGKEREIGRDRKG